MDMRTDFEDRQDLIDYVKQQFADVIGDDVHVSPIQGGRVSAEQQLAQIDPKQYERTRNYTDGAVTGLSPYIRHGVLSIAEVRDHALQVVRNDSEAKKLVNELGWRDYYQRVYQEIGAAIWDDREAWKTGYPASAYQDDMPDDIIDATTGLKCIDAWSTELQETGYLHNHVRMYFAAYIVHWRRVKWQVGASWFLQHLLDGDPASNNLSWQWVASTFSHKPYIFNRENLEKYTKGEHCRTCPLYKRCDFEGSYDYLNQKLFPNRT